jgi:Cdc6-like AAA superfamily ATPase
MSVDVEKMKKIAQVGQAFCPGAPINQYSLFAGRIELVKDVIRGINQRGQHVILYGERGVGKTSLANVMKEFLEKGVSVVKVNCDTQDKYKSLWQKVLREIVLVTKSKGAGFVQSDTREYISLDSFVQGKEEIHPEDVRCLLDFYQGLLVIIIDEVDRIDDKQTTTLMADTIKTLSDHSSTSTIILVGVADSVDELIAEHLSIERALVQVRMPRMSIPELQEILDKGYQRLNISIKDEAKKQIVQLSQGLPHYTHLLGLHSAEAAIENDRSEIDESDVDEAIKRAINKAQQTIIGAYNRAVNSPRKTLFSQVLLSCALAKKDILGTFTASDVRQPMTLIMGEKYEIPAFARHLNDFCDCKRGPVLEKQGSSRRFRYRFANPMLEPYTILHGLATGVISKEKLEKMAE